MLALNYNILVGNIPFGKSRDSSVGIALGYGMDDRGSTVRFQTGAEIHWRVLK
jgi:hypothetical protein